MKKIQILFVTKMRGFFKHLLDINCDSIKFCSDNKNNQFYEKNSNIKMFIRRIIISRWMNHFGIIQCIKKYDDKHDIMLSYNRFMKTNKPYIIILENPTALYHYCLDRNTSFIGKRKIRKYLTDNNLKAIICMSNACYSTIDQVLAVVPKNVLVRKIYPLVPANSLLKEIDIKKRSYNKVFRCIYISSKFELKSGNELVEVFERFKKEGLKNIKLNIITDLTEIKPNIRKRIEENDLIELDDFNFTHKELEKKYIESNLLLHLSRQDSFPLTVLEGLKAALPVLATNIYGIPEMVEENKNGYLISPKYWFFTEDKLPNRKVWNNRESTIYSTYIDENIMKFAYENIKRLYNDRTELYRLSINSLNKAVLEEFNEEKIIKEWEELIYNLNLR